MGLEGEFIVMYLRKLMLIICNTCIYHHHSSDDHCARIKRVYWNCLSELADSEIDSGNFGRICKKILGGAKWIFVTNIIDKKITKMHSS